MGVQQRFVTLDDAFERARRGNLIFADIVSRMALDRAPNDLAGLNLLGFVAIQAGLIGPAFDIFQRAHAAWPQAGLDATVARLEPMLGAWRARQAARRPEERFLLIKAWGYGFGSELASLFGALLLAELTARTPVIHWGPNCLYSDGSASDSFRYYFEPINDLRLDDLRPIAACGVFPGKWKSEDIGRENLNKFDGADSRLGALYFLAREEPLVVFDFNCGVVDLLPWIPADHPYHGLAVPELSRLLWRKHFRPTARVSERAERFAAEHWPEGRVLAVHFRDGDHRYEQGDLLGVNAQYFDLIDRILTAEPASIYLMTDSTTALETFRGRYGDRVFATSAQRTSDDTGIHYNPGADKVRLGVDILSDMLLGMRADSFVGNGRSSPSAMVSQLKEWAPGTAHLIVPNIYEERNVFLYDY